MDGEKEREKERERKREREKEVFRAAGLTLGKRERRNYLRFFCVQHNYIERITQELSDHP